MLIIVNPYATTVSDRLKNLVVYALRGSYEVDAIDTEASDHATELCRAAARDGYDVVVAFGGFGSVPGAMVAGLLIGVIQSLSAYFFGPVYKDIIVYGLFVLILWVRPEGLFGKAGA